MIHAPDPPTRHPRPWQAILILWLPLLLVYSHTFHTPWIFDDAAAIEKNPTIRQWTWINGPLQPPGDGSPVTARPLLNLTFALNYAISGLESWSYRAVNLLIHGLNGWLLYGILRLILLHGRLPRRYRLLSAPLALATALLWLLHPLHTNVVTYTSQRAESLAACFYLFALYALVRGIIAVDRPRFWWIVCIAACMMGTMAKETIATFPILAVAMDRLFFADSWRSLLQKRWPVYAGLLTSWVFLGLFVLFGGNRAGSAGFLSLQAALEYASMQPQAIVTYLWRILLPVGLVFDYGILQPGGWLAIVPSLALVLALLLWTFLGLGRGYKAAFAGFWFFLILLPTSSLLPIVTQTMAEHRAYLSSAGIIVLGVLAAHDLARWVRPRLNLRFSTIRVVLAATLAMSMAWGWLTWQRNALYVDAPELWRDTIAKVPRNARAYNNLSVILLKQPDYPLEEVLAIIDQALALSPQSYENHSNRGNVLLRLGRVEEAAVAYERALEIAPLSLEAHNGMTVVFCEQRQWDQAIVHGLRTVELAPHWDGAWYNLGNAYSGAGQHAQALQAYVRSLELNENQPYVWNNLALTWMRLDQFPQARNLFEETLRRFPDYSEAWCNYGQLLVKLNQNRQAVVAFQRALQLRMDYWKAYFLLAEQLAGLGRIEHARQILESLVQLARQINAPLILEEARIMLEALQAAAASSSPPDPPDPPEPRAFPESAP